MSVEIGSTNEGRWELYHALNLRNKLRSRQAYLMALFQKACLFQKWFNSTCPPLSASPGRTIPATHHRPSAPYLAAIAPLPTSAR